MKQLKAAYRKKVKIFHPDVNKNVKPDVIKHINVAYEALLKSVDTKAPVAPEPEKKDSPTPPPKPKPEKPDPFTFTAHAFGQALLNEDGSVWDFIDIPKELAASGGEIKYILQGETYKITLPKQMKDGYAVVIWYNEPVYSRGYIRNIRTKMKLFCKIV